jgi:hypothetical protein
VTNIRNHTRIDSFVFAISVIFLTLLPVPAFAAGNTDLSIDIDNRTSDVGLVGTPYRYVVSVQHGGDGSSSLFPTATVVFEIDLPDSGLQLDSAVFGSRTLMDGDLECDLEAGILRCRSGATPLNFLNQFSGFTFVIFVTPTAPGDYTISAEGGGCRVDPDNVIDESDESNNDCTGTPDTVQVAALPTFSLPTRWLQVSMHEPFARIYDLDGETTVNAVRMKQTDGTELHALNDVVRDPTTDAVYVFHRQFQSNTHRLGTLDPAIGVTDIGDTGLAFHDATFADDGMLYAISRSGTLVSIDKSTALATPLCETGYGAGASGGYQHAGLAYDSASGQLVHVVASEVRRIDPTTMPNLASDPCPVVSTLNIVTNEFRNGAFYLEFIDGVLIGVSDSGTRLQLIADNGVTQDIATTPVFFHGMVPDPGTLPVTAPPCPAAYYLTSVTDFSYTESFLFALSDETAEPVFVAQLPYAKIDAVEATGTGKELVAAVSAPGGIYFARLDACTGEVLSEVSRANTQTIKGFDLAPSGNLRAFIPNIGLYEADPVTGSMTLVTPTGTGTHPGESMVIVNDEVILATEDSQQALDVFSLTAWDTFERSVALSYGPGLEPGITRTIDSMDAGPDGSIRAFITRTPIFGASNSSQARPNALVSIDASGSVQLLSTLPPTLKNLTGTFDRIFSDSFESLPRLVFVTSGAYNGDLMTAGAGASGVEGADNLCNQHAQAAGLPGTYTAWVSVGSEYAKDRISGIGGPYYLPDEVGEFAEKVADDLNDILTCEGVFPDIECLDGPINRDENGAILDTRVWTGTRENGNAFGIDLSATCQAWTDGVGDGSGCTGSSGTGGRGRIGESPHTRTFWTSTNFCGCQNLHHLYCFQD